MAEKASAAKVAANHRYNRKSYDTLLLVMPKGAREQIKQKAAADGISVNRYILEALEARSGLQLVLDGDFPAKK